MLNINCLLNNSSIKPALKEVTEYVGYKILESGKKATITEVYNTMRKLGIEVDMQTTSHLYEEVFDTNDKELFSDVKEVEKAREQTLRNIVNKKVVTGKEEIGRDNPSVSVASSVAGILQDIGKKNPTAQKELEQGLRKAAQRVLKNSNIDTSKASEKETLEDILNRVFRSETKQELSIDEVKGKMDTAKELFKQFQEDVNTLANEMAKKDAIGADKMQQYADVLQDAAYDLFMSQNEIKQVINDAFKETGFTKEVTAADGTKKLVTDWNKIISSNVDFKQTLNDVLRNKGFSPSQIQSVLPTLEREYNTLKGLKIDAKLNPKETDKKVVKTTSDLDKLVALNNMGVFQNENKKALYKLLGVSDMDITSLSVVENIAQIINSLDPKYKNSPTAVTEFNRLMELELSKIQDRDTLLKIVNGFSSWMQFANGMILTNPLNVTENAFSGVAQLAFTAATRPKTGLRYLRGALNVVRDIVNGGAREGFNFSDSFSVNINVGDKYNFQTAKSIGGFIKAVANVATRSALESVDSGIKNAMANIMFADSMEKILMQQGLTNAEAQSVINGTLYGNNPEVRKIAEQLADALEAAGVNLTKSGKEVKTKRIENELARANILTNGQFFQTVIEDLIAKRMLSPTARNLEINEDMFNGVLNATEATAGKGLGHSSDNWLFQKMFDQPSRFLSNKLKEARKTGDRGKIVGYTVGSTLHSSLNRFVGGSARWSWLTFQKVSGIGLLQTLITDVVFNSDVITPGGKKKFNADMMGKYLHFNRLSQNWDKEFKDGKPVREDGRSQAEFELEKYQSLRERLKRQVIGTSVGYTIAALLLPTLAKLLGFGYDDDDSDEKKAKQAIKMAMWLNDPDNADVANIVKKVENVQLQAYIGTLAHKNLYGQAILMDKDLMKTKDNELYKTLYNTDVLRSIFIDNFNRGGEYQLLTDVVTENAKKDGSIGKVLASKAVQLSNMNLPFKYYDQWNNLYNGVQFKQRVKLPTPGTIQEKLYREEFTREMYRKYMKEKGKSKD